MSATDRRHDLDLLDHEFRAKLELLVDALAAAQIPLTVYETIRSPARQAILWARGRTAGAPDYGRTVTRARPYESAHQFGLAADLVFRVDGEWTWEEPEPGMWSRMSVLAARHGLETLRFERPHVQLAGFDWRDHVRYHDRGPVDEPGWTEWLRGRVG